MRQKKQDIIILVLIDIIAIIVSLAFKTNFFISMLLFLGLPSLFLLYKERAHWKNALFAASVIGILFGFIFDFIAELNGAWTWHSGLIFGEILGVVHIDVMIWFFLWIFHVCIFYEHFIATKDLQTNTSKQQFVGLAIGVLSLVFLLIINKLSPSILHINKAYLTLGLVTLIPFLVVLYKKPKLVWQTLPVISYFIFVYLTYELTALSLGQWSFPGDYIGTVNILNNSFPIEELVFWIILNSLIVSVTYAVVFRYKKTKLAP